HLEHGMNMGAGAARLHHALSDLLAHGRHGHKLAWKLLEGWSGRCGRDGWTRLRLRLDRWHDLRLRSRGTRGYGLLLGPGAMLLNKILNVVLSNASAQAS